MKPTAVFSPAFSWLRVCALGAVLLGVVGSGAETPPAELSVDSPNGRLSVCISTRGPLTYRLLVDGVPALRESRLGLRLRDGELGRDVTLVTSARREADDRWTNPFGKRRDVRDHHRELAVTLREKSSGGEFQVIFRVFDDGIGFRYELPERGGPKEFVVEEELTQFAFTADNLAYAGDHVAIPPEDYDSRGGFAGSQEWEFRRQRLSDLSPDTVTGLPLVTQTPAGWVAVTEADLLDWAGMWRSRAPQADTSAAVTLRARLAPRSTATVWSRARCRATHHGAC